MSTRQFLVPTLISCGILASGGAAAFAITQSVQAQGTDTSDIVLVAESQTTQSQAAPTSASIPTVDTVDLPPIPVVTDNTPTVSETVDAAPVPVAAAPTRNTAAAETPRESAKPTRVQTPEPSVPTAPPQDPKPSPKTEAVSVTSAQAERSVTAQAPGRVLSVSKESKDGIEAWRVTVERSDGSVVSGFVEVTSGTVFAWTLDKAAPAPTPTSQTPNSGNSETHEDEDEHENENEHENEHEDEHEDEHEGEDD